MLDVLATILKTQAGNAMTRAARMCLLPVCDRCGGSGRHSFNGSHSICYACAGDKCRPPKPQEWPDVIENAKRAVEDGQLERYLEVLEARRRAKDATDAVMSAWKATGISFAYEWRNAYPSSQTFNQRDCDIAMLNLRIATAYQKVAHESNKRTVDPVNLCKLVDEALAVIKQVKKELDAYQN